MKTFKDTNDQLHVIDEAFTHLLPDGCVEVTQQEADLIQNQPPVYTFEDIRHALQSAIDDKAQALGFSGGNALMLYAGFTNPFQIIAQGFAVWEASVWFEAEQYKAQVIAGNQPMLTPEQAVAMMPTYP